MFLDVDIRQPSGLGDWNAWKASPLANVDSSPIPPGCMLLADAGYFAHPTLLTPYNRQRTELSVRQHNFNLQHSRGRVVVEDAFGILKGRFPRVGSEMNVLAETVPRI